MPWASTSWGCAPRAAGPPWTSPAHTIQFVRRTAREPTVASPLYCGLGAPPVRCNVRTRIRILPPPLVSAKSLHCKNGIMCRAGYSRLRQVQVAPGVAAGRSTDQDGWCTARVAVHPAKQAGPGWQQNCSSTGPARLHSSLLWHGGMGACLGLQVLTVLNR